MCSLNREFGLPDAAVQESRQRVQAAIKNAWLPYPRKRLVEGLLSWSNCKLDNGTPDTPGTIH